MACCGGGGCGSNKGPQNYSINNGDVKTENQKELNIEDTIHDDKLLEMLKKYFTTTSTTCDGNNDDGNSNQIEKQIYQQYKSVYPTSTLVRIVETLAFALTDADVGNRAKGTSLLAESIFQCLPGSMNNLEVSTLVRFFCDRLKDHHSIQPIVIYAFLGLLSYQNVSNELIVLMLQGVFSEVHIQSLLQADRRNVFNIFSNLLKTKADLLKSISSEFVFGYIQAMDGEKDPRNLLICFENSHLLIQHVDITLFAEDLFEILSCYFPVEFRAPKDDQFRIKKEDLVLALRKCLSATPLFGPYSVPLYVEKLSSDLMESKLDALTTFIDSLFVYNPEDIALHIDDIWLAIRKDYLLSDFPEVGPVYLDFIHKLFKCLSSLENIDPLMKMVKFLTTDISQTLKDPEMTIAESCGNVILQTCNASLMVYAEVKQKVIPLLQSTLEKYTSPYQRTKTLEMIANILAVDNTQDTTEDEILSQFVLYLLPILYENIANSDDAVALQTISLKCIEHIVGKAALFESTDFSVLCQHCVTPIQIKTLSAELLSAYKSFIFTLSQHFPRLYLDHFLQFLLANSHNNKPNLAIFHQHMELLVATCLESSEEVREKVYQYFSEMFSKALPTDHNVGQIESALGCFLRILKKNKKTLQGHVIVVPLLNILNTVVVSPDTLMLKICHALSESYHHLSLEEQENASNFVKSILLNDQCNGILFGVSNNLSFNINDHLLKVSFLARGVLTQTLITSESTETRTLCERLLNIMQTNEDVIALENFGIVFGSILNKLPLHSSLVTTHIDFIKEKISVAGNEKTFFGILLNWMVKGLVLNWQPATTTAIDLMIRSLLLKNEVVASTCVQGFAKITSTHDEFVFTKRANAIIKPIHKQRYAEYVLPLLIQSYNNNEEGEQTKSYLMMAISNTLNSIPDKMLRKHLKSLMPLLMHSLATCTSNQIIESTLSTILPLLQDLRNNQDEIINYVPSLLNRLIEFMSSDRMCVRILAVKCLTTLSCYTIIVVQPLRGAVLKGLGKLLDDPKRLVRKEAVNCSNSWHLMGTGDTD